MEFLAAFGLASKELFDYNRTNFQFDQSQRLDRELMRLEMQIKRFELFREDLRDLVELCVGRMEMYQLVGAMFLEFCVALYCEGSLRHSAPAFILGLFYLTVASSFLYLVLAVWLSMHASICAHSFGVRLLTRYVRLPIPSIAQLGALNARLADFEQQGARMVRVPFVGGEQQWLQRQVVQQQERGQGSHQAPNRDLLGQGEAALGNEETFMKSTTKLPGKHVLLFRRLQCKWQCYDAYARVCMALGCTMILQSICYYLINVCLFEFRARGCCLALITAFQAAALAISHIDLARLGNWKLLLHSAAMVPCYLAAGSLILALPDEGEELPLDGTYWAGPVCFALIIVWLECLLHLAWPSQDEATLPRRFRAVLFLDVFEEADPTEAEHNTVGRRKRPQQEERDSRRALSDRAAAADEALQLAHCGLRRWDAVPAGVSQAQQKQLKRLRGELRESRQALNGEVARLATRRGLKDAARMLEDDARPWDELTDREQAEDPLSGTLLGPFEHHGAFGTPTSYHFDLERQDFVWQIADGQRVLTLEELESMVQVADRQVRQVLQGMSPTAAASRSGGSGGSGSSRNPAKRTTELPRFTVQRLPWQIVYSSTRTVQVAWLLMAASALAHCVWPSLMFDVQVLTGHKLEEALKLKEGHAEGEGAHETLEPGHEGHGSDEGHSGTEGPGFHGELGEHEGVGSQEEPSSHEAHTSERRLAWRWDFEEMDLSWPQRSLFRPQALSCLPSGDLMLSTPYELYSGSFEPLGLPASAVCRADGSHCLLATASQHAVTLWSGYNETSLAIEGWRMVTGAAVPCVNVSSEEENWPEWCLLLVGWDGVRLPAAVLPLPAGHMQPPPAGPLKPSFDVPLRVPRGLPGAGERSTEVIALHLEPRNGRLWVLLRGGGLQAWEMLRPRSLGRWWPRWPDGFAAAALCEGPRGLLVAGRGADGARMLRAEAPELL